MILFYITFVLSCIYLCGFVISAKDDSVLFDVDLVGDSMMSNSQTHQNQQSQSQENDLSISVHFSNLFNNETIFIYWEADRTENDILIAEVLPSSDVVVTTYPHHRFYALLLSDMITRAYPGIIEVIDDNAAYSYGPDPEGYKRAKIHPKVKFMNQPSKSIGARFKCLVPAIDIWYEDGGDGSYQGSLTLGQETTTNTYIGHIFYFTEKGNKAKEIARHVMKKDVALYLVEDKNSPPPRELREQIDRELKYIEDYKNRTGIIWRHYFGPDGPRPPPKLYMWPTPEIGYVHRITSDVGFWKCDGPAEKCQAKETLEFDLEVISTHPKVFVIENFFSEYEANTIMQLAHDKLALSLVGNKEAGGARTSETRTSRNAWLSRETSPVLESIYRRAGHLLKIDERILRPEYNAEQLQVVRYQQQQKYDAHHDWGVRGAPESRFLTLLLYLNDQVSPDAGGETSFPLAADGRGIKIHPGKGNAVLFYNLLEDGNADELALHSGTAIFNGTKWVSNLWVWDPKKT